MVSRQQNGPYAFVMFTTLCFTMTDDNNGDENTF